MDFNKTENIKTHIQLKELIAQYKNFIETGEGQPVLFLEEFKHLVSGNFKTKIKVEEYTWVNKSLKEIEKEEKKVQDETDLLLHYKTPEGLKDWRTRKLHPISFEMFQKWIDEPVNKPYYYNLSEINPEDIKSKHQEIYVFHNITEYKTDEELEALKPEKPSWAKLELSK